METTVEAQSASAQSDGFGPVYTALDVYQLKVGQLVQLDEDGPWQRITDVRLLDDRQDCHSWGCSVAAGNDSCIGAVTVVAGPANMDVNDWSEYRDVHVGSACINIPVRDPLPAVPTDLMGLVELLGTKTVDEQDQVLASLRARIGDDRADGLFREASSIVAHDRRLSSLRGVLAERVDDALAAALDAQLALEELRSDRVYDVEYAEGDGGADLAHQLRVAARSLRMANLLCVSITPDAAVSAMPTSAAAPDPDVLCAAPSSEDAHAWLPAYMAGGQAGPESCGLTATHPIHDVPAAGGVA